MHPAPRPAGRWNLENHRTTDKSTVWDLKKTQIHNEQINYKILQTCETKKVKKYHKPAEPRNHKILRGEKKDQQKQMENSNVRSYKRIAEHQVKINNCKSTKTQWIQQNVSKQKDTELNSCLLVPSACCETPWLPEYESMRTVCICRYMYTHDASQKELDSFLFSPFLPFRWRLLAFGQFFRAKPADQIPKLL